MRPLQKSVLDKRLPQEILVFGALFILVTLNSWTALKTFDDFIKAITYFSILYVHVQLHRLILIPALEQKKKYAAYISITIACLLLFSWLLFTTDDYWFKKRFGYPSGDPLPVYIYHIGTCSLGLVAMLVPFLLLKYFKEQRKLTSVKLAMHKVELRVLRSQLNPHFLFNAFNNIYGLSLNDHSRVPQLILHLSKLMRYQLENNNKEWIPLEEELGFIESYIALEEERLGRRCEIRYEYDNSEANANYYIAPLVLVSFIENAFKHGTYSLLKAFVYITIVVKKGMFKIAIINSMPAEANNKHHGGVGQHNATQLLDIVYASKYTLTKAKDESKYSVYLTLPLISKNDAEQNTVHDSR